MKRLILIYILCACGAAQSLWAQTASDFTAAARAGNPTAQYNLAQCHLYGWGTPADSTKWRHYLRLAAEGGVVEAREQMARLDGVRHPELSAYWLQQSSTLPTHYTYLSYEDGYYYGEHHRGVREGYGTFVWDSGVSHTGSWEDGERYGMGITYFGEQTLIGAYNDQANGAGAIIIHSPALHFPSAPGSRLYVGYIEGGHPNGRGTLYDSEGRVTYYGNFKDGRPTGTYPSVESYNTYSWTSEELSTGDSWEGEKHNGVREGFGIYRWKDGSAWYGLWVDDLREGDGLYIRADGAIMTGVWSSGELNIGN